MKRFFNDLFKYRHYILYAAKSDLKSEVANSYLNWLWWILDPFLFMMVYTFISSVVFKSKEPYFPVFVFIGLAIWDFFNKTVIGSVKLVQANSHIVSKVYLPKFILVFQREVVNGFKMSISFLLIIFMMILYRVPLSNKYCYLLPTMAALLIFTFGVSTIVLHFGVFVEDLANVLTVVLRLVFYLSGIFFSIEKRVPFPYNSLLLKCNPIALLIQDARNILLYGLHPHRKLLLVWFLAGLLLSMIGIQIIYKYENSYVKVS